MIGYGVEVDMWSLGVLVYIMLVGYAPFRHENRSKLFQLIQHGKYSITSTGWDKITKGDSPQYPTMFSLVALIPLLYRT